MTYRTYDATKEAMKRAVLDLRKNIGEVVPINEIKKMAGDVPEEDARKALDELKDANLISYIDDESIQVHME